MPEVREAVRRVHVGLPGVQCRDTTSGGEVMAIQVAVVAAWAALVNQVVGYWQQWQERRKARKAAAAEKKALEAAQPKP